jgi:oxysterol-binding protein-related protein 9/10/11
LINFIFIQKKVILKLDNYNEEYIFTLPSCYARSIVTNPWTELGDICLITCPQTGYISNIDFQIKSFYGEQLNNVNADIKNENGEIICKINGKWNGLLEYEFMNNESANQECKTIDTTNLKTFPKRVRPLSHQNANESRRVWHSVSESLLKGDIQSASLYKNGIEKQQRNLEKQKREYQAVHFIKTHLSFDENIENIIRANRSLKHDIIIDEKQNQQEESIEQYHWFHRNW